MAYDAQSLATHSCAQIGVCLLFRAINLCALTEIFRNTCLGATFRHSCQELQRIWERCYMEAGSMAHATPCFEYLV